MIPERLSHGTLDAEAILNQSVNETRHGRYSVARIALEASPGAGRLMLFWAMRGQAYRFSSGAPNILVFTRRLHIYFHN